MDCFSPPMSASIHHQVQKQVGNDLRVIGVQVASHDNTTPTPPVERVEDNEDYASHESASVALALLSSNIHGHSATL